MLKKCANAFGLSALWKTLALKSRNYQPTVANGSTSVPPVIFNREFVRHISPKIIAIRL